MSRSFLFFLIGFVLASWAGSAHATDCTGAVVPDPQVMYPYSGQKFIRQDATGGIWENTNRVQQLSHCYTIPGNGQRVQWQGNYLYTYGKSDGGWCEQGEGPGAAGYDEQYYYQTFEITDCETPCELQWTQVGIDWACEDTCTGPEAASVCLAALGEPSCPGGAGAIDGIDALFVCDSATCINGVLDPGETGIDCGGSCSGTCDVVCPDGWSYGFVDEVDTGENVLTCYASSFGFGPDAWNNCPSGTGTRTDLPGQCFELAEGTLANTSNYNYTQAPDPNPWNEQTDTTSTTVTTEQTIDPDTTVHDIKTTVEDKLNADSSQSKLTTREETITNPDGSSTVITTTTNTTLNTDNSSSTIISTVTQNFDSGGGLVSQSSSSTSSESTGGKADELGGGLAGKSIRSLNFQPFYDLQTKLSQRFPISLLNTVSSYLDSWIVPATAPVWHLALPNPWGSDWAFDIDLAPMQSIADTVRLMLNIFIIVCVFYVIYRRWV